MGHNEYVERRFFAPFLNEAGWRRAARGALHRWRLYVALRRGLARLSPGPRAGEGATDLYGVGPTRDDSRRLPRNAEEDRLVAEQFRFALAEMAAVARQAAVPLLLVQPAANLRDWAPEASDWSENLAPADRRQRDLAYAAAQAAWLAGDAAATVGAADAVLRLDSRPAHAHFLRGRALLALGRRDEARTALAAARDLDAVPIRRPGFLGEAIRQAWARFDLTPLDGEAALAAASADGIVGDEMILDYCHPTPAGHQRLAGLLWPAIHGVLWPGEPVPDWPGAAAPAEANAGLYASGFGAAWSAQMLLRQGKLERATELFRRAVALDPDLATAHEGLGRALGMAGQLEEATTELELATRLAPEVANGWNNLGLVYVASGRADAAVAAFRRALDGGVGEAVVRRNLAGALLRLGRLAEARVEIEAALERSPADAAAWLRLGEIAVAQDDLPAARRAYEQALVLDPASAAAQQGLAALP
jgi:tetratricopeptide (TPR) repeat protein